MAASSDLRLTDAPLSEARRKLRFYAESFAPWCERARWALDHHRIAYREIAQMPLVAELSLRLAVRKPMARVTVPLLVDRDVALMSSDAIARYAEGKGRGAALFPTAHEDAIDGWMRESEALMVAGRAMLLPRMAESPATLREQLPPVVPRAVRPALEWVARAGVSHVMRKYGIDAASGPQHERESRRVLDTLRQALASGRSTLVGDTFSYADITMAAALQFVLPVDQKYVALGPRTREAWTHAGLAADHPDLLSWRDRLYAAHR